ncbi:lysophospholipid acyltransferase 5-like [Asterias rubens]|uniref:lysophospholipid acyltransferase 5-like n=1 Tax=Asterias rubens TaxID=7604 RepID=UPI0014554972|nr:lysophospholipid acyltransferase 5-like [Asterias rubens]
MEQESTEASPSLLGDLAGRLGLDVPALLYLFTFLAGFPLAYISRTFLHGQSPTIKHTYFTVCCLVLAYLNFGYDIIHSAISVLINYALLVTIGGTPLSVAISFTFNMSYLLTAYIYLATDGYDLIWTTPHCILTLRLIGTAWDLYDGQKKEEQLSAEQKLFNIKTAPSLLELAGYTYFFGGFFASPQFSLRRYLDFTKEKLLGNDKGELPSCVEPAMNRFYVGCFYVFLHCALSPFFPNEYLLSAQFANSSFPYQVFVLVFWSKSLFFKYSSVFMFTEGVCTMAGLTYNGKDEKGNALWDACVGLRPKIFEIATISKHCVISFNISTNLWASRYVFKRLKFLNNKYISQASALFFLAIWHGFFIGYFICFVQEFFVTFIESQITDATKRIPALSKIVSTPAFDFPLFAIKLIWNKFVCGHALAALVLLRWSRIHVVYSAMYYMPVIFYITFPLLYSMVILPQLNKIYKPQTESPKDNGKETAKTK